MALFPYFTTLQLSVCKKHFQKSEDDEQNNVICYYLFNIIYSYLMLSILMIHSYMCLQDYLFLLIFLILEFSVMCF